MAAASVTVPTPVAPKRALLGTVWLLYHLLKPKLLVQLAVVSFQVPLCAPVQVNISLAGGTKITPGPVKKVLLM